MFLVPSKTAQHIWQKRFRTNSINNMRRGRTKFLTFSNKTDRNTRFLYCLRHSDFHVMERFGLSCHVLSGHNVLKTVHGAACFLETECHVPPRPVVPYQTTSRSLFARRRPRRSATWRETQEIQFDSGTVPYQPDNNSIIILRATHGFPPGNKQTQKGQTKRTTTRRRQLLTPLCKAKSVATTSACSEQQLNTRQNRCLHSFCKSCGAGVSHNVQGEIEAGQGGVRLVILQTSDCPCQRTSGCTHACCHTPLQQRSPSSSQGNELRDWSESVRRDISFLFFLSLSKHQD